MTSGTINNGRSDRIEKSSPASRNYIRERAQRFNDSGEGRVHRYPLHFHKRRHASTTSLAKSVATYITNVTLPTKYGDAQLSGSAVSGMSGSVVDHKLDHGYSTDYTGQDFECGDIIWAPHVVPSLNKNNLIGSESTGYIKNTGPVSGKNRPCIILAKFSDHSICIPLFTHSGSGQAGLRNLPGSIGEQSMLLTHAQEVQNGYWDGARPSDFLVVEGPFKAKEGCVAHIGEPVMIQYQYPISKSGRLQDRSLVLLFQRFMCILNAGTDQIRHLMREQKFSEEGVYAKAQFEDDRHPERGRASGGYKRGGGRARSRSRSPNDDRHYRPSRRRERDDLLDYDG